MNLRNLLLLMSIFFRYPEDIILCKKQIFGGVSVGRGSWVVGPKSWVVGSKSWVAGPKSWVVGSKSWVVGY